MMSLSQNGAGGYFNGQGQPGATGLISSSDDIIDWLNRSVLPVVFKDSTCGDGQCDPEEQKGIGRFGW